MFHLFECIENVFSGNTYADLQYGFRVAENTICHIIPETCEAIIAEYAEEYVHLPTTEDEWKQVADGFKRRWNWHNCLGALDGKHVRIRCPPHSGSVYYNYKGFFSIVLLALVDSNYRFLFVEVGANGGSSDGGVFERGLLRQAVEEGTLGIPPPTALDGDEQQVPYSFVGDDAFPLRPWLLKPYANRGRTYEERIFNYRLSRARRVVENAFGILANRFRFLHTTMGQHPSNVESCVLAACVLHNIMRTRFPTSTNSLVHREGARVVHDGTWRDNAGLVGWDHMRGNNQTKQAREQRDFLKAYYGGPGAVPWQDRMI